MGSKRLTVEFVRSFLDRQGCKYISTEGTLSKGKMRYIARCGHEYACTFSDFKRGLNRICRECNFKEGGRKLATPYETVAKRVSDAGCRLITKHDEYINQSQKVKIVGKCRHEISTTLKAFFSGKNHICKKCEEVKHREYKRLPYETVSRWFSDNGCKLLSKTYTGCMEKLKYIAQCGHENEMSLNEFQAGSGRKCKRCTKSNSSQQIVEDAVRDALDGRYDVVSEFPIKTRIGNQRIDIAIPDAKIAVEYNGEQHYREIEFFSSHIPFKRRVELDEAKEQWCIENGFSLIKIDGREWYKKRIAKETFKKEIRALILPIIAKHVNTRCGTCAYEMWKPGELDENSDKKHLDSGTLIYIEDANGDVEEEFVDGFGWI